MTDREKAIVMAYTGCTMLAGDKLGIYYQYVQEKLGRSVTTHELVNHEVQDAIKEAARKDFQTLAKADNGWISVKDRMPEKDGLYLVYGMSNAMHKLLPDCVPIWLCYWHRKYGGWYDIEMCMGYDFITHWMYLPEPPKEEKHND